MKEREIVILGHEVWLVRFVDLWQCFLASCLDFEPTIMLFRQKERLSIYSSLFLLHIASIVH